MPQIGNRMYPSGRHRFLMGDTAWDTSTIRAALVRNYTYSDAHTTLADVEANGDVITGGGTQTMTTVASSGGIADANDVTFTSISGAAIDAVVIFHEVAAADASRFLLGYIDTAAGLPGLVPNGGNIVLTWDNGVNKIFKL
jgi:hypothetical protein